MTNLLLARARMVTLVGVGGIGKTRLAAEAVERYGRATGTPVHWVRLASLFNGSSDALITEHAAQTVSALDFSARSGWDALTDTLATSRTSKRRPHTILVLDNCEHVLAGVSSFSDRLLDEIEGLTILATSREPLSWMDEQLVSVPPLTRAQALELFRQRAVLTGRPVNGMAEIRSVERICRRVDNNPLFIQLAAARLRYQPVAAIVQEVDGGPDDRRMRWSHGPKAGGDARHRSVVDVIEWSYSLCGEKEKLLLERMSVFAAGYDAEPGVGRVAVGADASAIAAVCGGPLSDADGSIGSATVESSVLDSGEIPALLERLADRSLVSSSRTATSVRYSLLESIRVFAAYRLRERSSSAEEQLRSRHRHYYRDVLRDAQSNWYSSDETRALEWASAAWNDLCLAIEGSLREPEDAIAGLEISILLISLRAPFFRGALRSARRWAERALEAARPAAPVELQIRATALISWLALCQGDNDVAASNLEKSVRMCGGDPAPAQSWDMHSARDFDLPAIVDFAWGAAVMLVHADASAVAVLGRARTKFHRCGDRGGEAMSELFEALAAAFLLTGPAALDLTERHFDRSLESGATWALSWSELARAIALTKHGRPVDGLSMARQALARQMPIGDQWGAVWAVHIRTWALAHMLIDSSSSMAIDSESDQRLALEIAQLTGGARNLRARLRINEQGLGMFIQETQAAVEAARRILGDERFGAAEAIGLSLDVESSQPQQLALGMLSPQRVGPVRIDEPRNSATGWPALTAAEQDVAELAAAGYSNSAIAARRGSASKTIDAQMTAIFQKLMIRSRKDIARFVPRDSLKRVEEAQAYNSRRGGSSESLPEHTRTGTRQSNEPQSELRR
ncbi:hypothetical protein IU427_25540 [Nocardia beijingensis]|uniref:LuxR C-terminal-related transcriptional regulator n=1 Tax=Nocardia beijingensis TaxID=95162 RepID=UPI001893FAF3|nr:hypothetical protein [Nocardia beijingensis]